MKDEREYLRCKKHVNCCRGVVGKIWMHNAVNYLRPFSMTCEKSPMISISPEYSLSADLNDQEQVVPMNSKSLSLPHRSKLPARSPRSTSPKSNPKPGGASPSPS